MSVIIWCLLKETRDICSCPSMFYSNILLVLEVEMDYHAADDPPLSSIFALPVVVSFLFFFF